MICGSLNSNALRRQHGGRHGRRPGQGVFTGAERAEDFNHRQRSAGSTQKVTKTRSNFVQMAEKRPGFLTKLYQHTFI